MEYACSTPDRLSTVRTAIDSLMAKLNESKSCLAADTLNLLGNEGSQYFDIDRERLIDVAFAFIDLLEGRIVHTAHSTDIMPGSKPYARRDAT